MEGDVWNEREINRRSQIIADYVKQIWPHAAALRRQLRITSPQEEADGIPGLSGLMAERLVDSVTESGADDGWANTEGLNRSRRDMRYGRYVRLGGGDRWQVVWFGVSRELGSSCWTRATLLTTSSGFWTASASTRYWSR